MPMYQPATAATATTATATATAIVSYPDEQI